MKLNMRIKSLTPYLMVVLLVGLQACGGGSSTPAAPLADQDASGIYTGSATVNGGAVVSDLRGIIYNNRFMVFSVASNTLYDGTISSITSTSLVATANVYQNGAIHQTGINITGTVNSASQITGTLSGTGIANGTFSLTYDGIYTRGATLARINSEASGPSNTYWIGDVLHPMPGHSTDSFSKYDVTFDVALNNYTYETILVTTPIQYCGFKGEILIPNTEVNIYTVLQKRFIGVDSDCSLSLNNSTGMVAVVDDTGADDTLWYVAVNDTESFMAVLVRESY